MGEKAARAIAFSILAALVLAAAQAQAMKGPTPGSGGGASSMTAPNEGRAGASSGTGPKIQFTNLEAARTLAARTPTILFFAADWCPTCKEALRDIDARGRELAGASLVVVNYDASSELKRRYGVSYQHTFVWIDAAGTAIDSWNGGGVDAILARIGKGR